MDNQVNEVKQRTDIASIIGERIELKKAGRNYKANCPFHGEKTPSFMVSPELQIFKCFGCGEAGDAFSFLEKYEGMDFPEALKYLADRAGIKLIKTNFGETNEKEKLIEIHNQTLKFYQYLLLKHPLGRKALEYLIKTRGLKKETIEEFDLGYSPEDSRILEKFLITKKKFQTNDLEKAGIVLSRGGGIYDRFNGRVIFPLYDHRGNPIGFSGRVLPWDKRDTGKYINSPETPIYHKSNVLYGLNLTRTNIKMKKVAIVVEGELDLISSYQAGIKNIVAIKGSALTEEQVRLLSRFAPKFILALDSDFAGDAAARRGITVAENSGIEVKVAKISKYKDPDEAARADLQSYKSDLIHAEGVWDFLTDSVFARFKGESGEDKAKISKEIVPIIAQIEDKIVQAHYVSLIARRLSVPTEAVMEQIENVGSNKTLVITPPVSKTQEAQGRRELLQERLLILALQNKPADLLEKDINGIISKPAFQKIISCLREIGKFEAAEFGKSLPPELFETYSGLMLTDAREEDYKKELDLIKKELKILIVKDNLKLLTSEMKDLEEKGDRQNLLKAQNKFNKLAKKLSDLETDTAGGIILSEE